MASYLHPGVYIEEIPSGSKPIEAVGTSTACFIGFTAKGHVNNSSVISAGNFDPELINKWDDYDELFGGIRNEETTTSGAYPMGDPMGNSVYAFFKNGGTKAYIIRCAASGTKSAGSYDDSTPAALLTFTASNEGTWGDELIVKVTPKPGAVLATAEFTVQVGEGTIASGAIDTFNIKETFTDVSLDSNSPAYIEHKINDGSSLVSISVTGSATDAATQLLAETNGYGYVQFGSGHSAGGVAGANGSDGATTDYDAIFTALLKYRDVNIICLPGKYYNGDSGATSAEQDMVSVIDSAIAHCETMKNRMVVVDPPYASEFGNEKDVNDLALPTSTYTALYYPWVKVANPHYDADDNPGAATNILVPPSAYAAGMWAKIDGKRGVWKAPAGIEAKLLGAAGLEFVVEDAEQDYLNPVAVNCLRTLPSYGRVVWGARTLATKADPEWRYVPVRRTAMLIEESIFNGIQWAVFEPNNHNLWSALRNNIGSFMNGLFRAGAFQGEKANDAYFVRCGLGDTMTQGDIDRGQVIVIVGFAPLKPAEFVIVRIQQMVGQE